MSRPTATNWLNSLVDLGFLIDVKRGKTRLFINHRFLDILTRDTEPELRLEHERQ